MYSSADVDIEAIANAKRCSNAMWGWLPCQPSWRGCPFGRKPPQKSSEHHCEDVTPEMWAEAVQSKCLAQSLRSLCFAIGGTHVAGWVEEAEKGCEGREDGEI